MDVMLDNDSGDLLSQYWFFSLNNCPKPFSIGFQPPTPKPPPPPPCSPSQFHPIPFCGKCPFEYRVIQVIAFFNFPLSDTKKLKNDKTQLFLLRIYLDIKISKCPDIFLPKMVGFCHFLGF